MNKLDPKAFGLACGILWSAAVLIMGLLALICGWAHNFVIALGILYVGYKATVVGSAIGAVWAFVDGGICGFLLAVLYNKLANK